MSTSRTEAICSGSLLFLLYVIHTRETWSDFPDSSVGKESSCDAGDPGSIPGLGRSPGEEIGYPLQYSWASLVAQLVKNLPPIRETWVPWRRARLPTPVFWPGEYTPLYSPLGRKELDTTKWFSLSQRKEGLFSLEQKRPKGNADKHCQICEGLLRSMGWNCRWICYVCV